MAKRLAIERKLRGFPSQSSLSRASGIHVTTLSQIENGHLIPYPGQIQKLVEALDWQEDPRLLFQDV